MRETFCGKRRLPQGRRGGGDDPGGLSKLGIFVAEIAQRRLEMPQLLLHGATPRPSSRRTSSIVDSSLAFSRASEDALESSTESKFNFSALRGAMVIVRDESGSGTPNFSRYR